MDMVPPNATKFYKDKFVVITSDKPIDSSHLDIVLMFLESASLSGGGNILNHEINARMNILTLEYEHRLFKHRVLQKKSLDFHGYKFTASEPGIELDEPEVIDDRLLILKNVSEDLDDFVVKLYVQNLAIEDETSNSITFMYRSQYFRHIFYVRFKKEIDFKYCLQRLQRRPTLNERSIEIQQGHTTNTIFFKANELARKRLSNESIQVKLGQKRGHSTWYLTFLKEKHF